MNRYVYSFKRNISMTPFRTSLIAAATGLAFPVIAQTAPDAGQLLQQNRPPVLQAPKPSTGIQIQTPATMVTLPGGAEVKLTGLSLQGNTLFSEAQLLAVLNAEGSITNKSYDLAGLRGLAEKISAHYRAAGYPFARAILPAQSLTGGALRIEVIEGRYGHVQTTGDAELAPQAQAFLASLQSGAVIESQQLERATLILDDQPGIKTAPLIRPGQALGTGDLLVDVSREPMVNGDVGMDNYGNRYTGAYRARANMRVDSPFMLGDQVTLNSMYSNGGTWLGSAGYSLPLGVSGLRGNVGYAHTYYELGTSEYKGSESNGTAAVSTFGITYPLVRSQKTNLTLGGTFQHKQLHDLSKGSNDDAVMNDRSSNTLPVSLQFDHRDSLLNGGVSYGVLTLTPGRLSLAAGAADSNNTDGRFNKWNLDVARIQSSTITGLTGFGRLSLQKANKNIDSSEGFGLGGATGVRAYPVGEAYGNEGMLAQVEMRYALNSFAAPYVFYDAGRVKVNVNVNPAAGNTENTRSIGGAGFGVRFAEGVWNADASLAWRTFGGDAKSDASGNQPRLWVTMGYRF